MSDLSDSGEHGGNDERVAEFALGVLPDAEHDAVARRLTSDPALRAAVRDWRRRLSGLDHHFAETAPPASVWPRIEGRLFGAPARTGWWNSLPMWRALAAGALAVAVVAVGFNVFRPATVNPQDFAVQLVAALQQQEGSGVEFVAFYDADAGAVKLLGLSGATVADKDYELWYIKGDEPAVSMGVIPVDQRKDIALDQRAREKFGEGTVLAVTLEQKGGSPTGKAQGPIVALGTALAI